MSIIDGSEGNDLKSSENRLENHQSLPCLVAATEQDHMKLTSGKQSAFKVDTNEEERDSRNPNDIVLCGICSRLFTSLKQCNLHMFHVSRKYQTISKQLKTESSITLCKI